MHDTALKHGRLFFECYCPPDARRVVELGSYDVNGTLRQVCPPASRYIGVDLEAGPGVDVLVQPASPLPFADGSIDIVVSSSVFEHDVCFWNTFLEQARVVRPGGFIYLNAPSNFAFHRYPLDCWRFYPDAGIALAAWAARSGHEVELIESFLADPIADGWADFVAVFWKRGPQPWTRRQRIADRTIAHHIFDAARPVPQDLERAMSEVPDMRRLADVRQQLATCQAELTGVRALVDETTQQCLEAKQAVVDQRQRALNERAELEQLRAALAASERQLAGIHRTWSWRLTAPLRWLR